MFIFLTSTSPYLKKENNLKLTEAQWAAKRIQISKIVDKLSSLRLPYHLRTTRRNFKLSNQHNYSLPRYNYILYSIALRCTFERKSVSQLQVLSYTKGRTESFVLLVTQLGLLYLFIWVCIALEGHRNMI